jgi:hypothetical protein
MSMFMDIAKAAGVPISEVDHLYFDRVSHYHWFLVSGSYWKMLNTGGKPESVRFDKLPEKVMVEALRFHVAGFAGVESSEIKFLGHTEMWMECWFKAEVGFWKVTIVGLKVDYKWMNTYLPEFPLSGGEQ